MMNVAQHERNVYEEFDLKSDILFFKLGNHGLVSFHGKNYNIKKRINAEQIAKLASDNGFFKMSSSCYINIGKIKSVASGVIYFGPNGQESKQLPVNRRKQHIIQQLFSQWMASKELRTTP